MSRYTQVYGIVHDVVLGASTKGVAPEALRLLLAIYEDGGAVRGPSETLGVRYGTNAVQIRRSAGALAAAGLVSNLSKRGAGMHIILTASGRLRGAEMLEQVRVGLALTQEVAA